MAVSGDQEYSFKPRYGWMWDVEYEWYNPKGYHQYFENLDIITKLRYIQLARKSTKSFYTTKRMYCSVNSWWNWFFAGENWFVYCLSNWNNVYSRALNTKDYRNIEVFWDYIYLFVDNSIDRITIANAEANIGTDWRDTFVTENWKTITTTTHVQTIIFNNNMYIVNWKSIDKIDNLWNQSTDVLTTDYNIVWITFYWPTIKVYDEMWNMFVWDWVSSAAESSYNLKVNIEYVFNDWPFDYIVWWPSTYYQNSLYVISGIDKQLLKRAKYNDNLLYSLYKFYSSNWYNWNSWIWKVNDLLYIPTVLTWSWNWKAKLYVYWHIFEWFPNSWSIYTAQNGDWLDMDNIFTLLYRAWKLWYSWQDASHYWIDYIDTASEWTINKQPTWTFITNKFDADYKTQQKVLKTIHIWCDIPSWTSLQILYKKDWGSFISIATLSNTDTVNWIYKATNLWVLFWEIEFKFIFAGSWSDSPKLYDFNIYWNFDSVLN
jgi:hypothetical protein